MTSRAFFAAIIAVSAAAGAADAATFHYRLTYDRTLFTDVDYYSDTADEDVHHDVLSANDDPWNLPLLFAGLSHGKTYDFRATIEDDVVTDCSIGTFNCTPDFDPFWSYASASPLHFGNELFHVSFGAGKGAAATSMLVSDVSDGNWGGFFVAQDDGFVQVGTRSTYFTVVQAELAPVPLPAGIALLPVGIGAFALMRRKKRAN